MIKILIIKNNLLLFQTKVKWVGEPVRETETRRYYAAVIINDEEVCNIITTMFCTGYGKPRLISQQRWFCVPVILQSA